eukprot:EG_transcript_17671
MVQHAAPSPGVAAGNYFGNQVAVTTASVYHPDHHHYHRGYGTAPSSQTLATSQAATRALDTTNGVIDGQRFSSKSASAIMTKIVQINSSAKATGSESTKLADKVVARLKELHPSAKLEVRDLATNPHPTLDGEGLGAIFTPADQRSPDQVARNALDEALIDQLKSADILVFGIPMYNFHVSTQFQSWVDAVAKAGVTFKYTPEGPVGLVTGKKVYVALARGGVYRDTPNDVQVPWLQKIFGFIGLTDVQYFYVEGLASGGEKAEKAWSAAEEEIKSLIV